MLKQMLQKAEPNAALHVNLVRIPTVALILIMSAMGAWLICVGLSRQHEEAWATNEWIVPGIVLLVGMFACAVLIWRRWSTDYSGGVAVVMLVQSVANVVSDRLRPSNTFVTEGMATTRLVLAVIFLGLVIAGELYYHKQGRMKAPQSGETGPLESEDQP